MKLYSKDEFKIVLRQTLESHLTLSHPLFSIIMDVDNPQLDLLKLTALQGYQLTKYFIGYVESLFFYCPLPEHKRNLLFNLFEEETGYLSKTKNHMTLMQDFLRAINISDKERDEAEPLPNTMELINYRLNACNNKNSYHIGAAAVLVASEGQNLEKIGENARHNILGKAYNLTDDDLLFFSVHQKEDVHHVNQGLDLLRDYCVTIQLQQEAIKAVDYTCQLFYNMYTGIYNQYIK
ncbi:pyrroloquinoline quinone biosynthesis protein PqqC [Snodgrassella communis]|uniref:PqqC-like protein n=1 Tax=Snodgrassella communis TaxID=2946699 RepID=A0A066TI81_9NEIS|nr:iron-containing redox enzyme family protein [Snodgrassella communis]KDN12090.1 PqqC-like protein [Snodgrassella communis]KDN14580.1 PqqC-like protein [Snodgrassella communis]PIT08112.1 pyrroloquinoline quinone biosynthesis protein PqqC [Snodgrassella communis]PIT26193.1 pyrroloquinoline quinone biosynthesis protein PqqC [Snodgrassella communis]PIT27912.1 pyrroloquinoline quinone biosynthesis protein PqqC [Snodgrassella communis]